MIRESNTKKKTDEELHDMRHPKSQGEKRVYSAAKDQGVKVRAKRNPENLGDYYDGKSAPYTKQNSKKKPERKTIRKEEDEESSDDKKSKRIKQAESMGYKRLPQHDAVWTHKGMKIYGVNNLPPLKDVKNKEEDEQSVYKQMKKNNGKVAFDGPEVKQRKRFAPVTKTESSGKQYKRKSKYGDGFKNEDNEENLSNRISKALEKYPDGEEVTIDSLKKEFKKRGYDLKSFDKESRDNMFKKPIKNNGKNGKNGNKTKIKKPPEEDNEKCWKGYKKQGTKEKRGKTVNNCVEVKESTDLSKFIEAIMTSDHAEAHKQLKNAINSKIQKRIAQEIDNPLF